MACEHRVRPPVEMSATLAINDEVTRLRAAGQKVFHLGFGEARFPVHPRVLAAFKEHAEERFYLPVAGHPDLRERVADFYRRRFEIDTEPSRVLIGSGSKSLLYAALAALEGDVILPTPCWVSYETQARLAGKAFHRVETALDEDYRLTPERLAAGIREARAAGGNPAALLLNTPNNPTGVIHPPELLAGLAEIARAEELMVISDEIYALTAHEGHTQASMARFYPEGTLVTSGLSKHLSLGGWRLGIALLPPGEVGDRLRDCMTGVAGAVWTAATSPVQHAAMVAFGDHPAIDAYVDACAALHGRLTRPLYRTLRDLGVPCPEPAGGFYLYPSFARWRGPLRGRHGVETCSDLARLLLEREQIATLPGASFGSAPGELCLRLSTSCLHTLADSTAEEVLALRELSGEELLRRVAPDAVEVGIRFGRFVESLEEQRVPTA